MTFAIAPIVEGHGDEEAVRILIERICLSLSAEDWPRILKPIRQPKGKLIKPEHLSRAVELAARKLQEVEAESRAILLLIDADEDCPGELGPRLLDEMRAARPDRLHSCCIANVEFETWFVASAESMEDLLDLRGEEIPEDPESHRLGKGWIARRYVAGKYRETIDQPRLTSRIDVSTCRRRSRSFDKLCREIEAITRGA